MIDLRLICSVLLSATFFLSGTVSSGEDNFQVLEKKDLKTSAEKLLYEHFQAQAHTALDRRLEESEQLDTAEKIAAWQKSRREFFTEQLGGFPERTPLNAQIMGTLKGDGFSVEKVIFESRPHHHVTSTMYLPTSKGPFPCVIVASGHSRTGKAAEYNQRFGMIMAKNGIAALLYDPIGQGERSMILDANGQPKFSGTTTEHFQVGVGSILVGRNTAGYRVWDGMRAIDYVQSRDDVIDDRIGFTGCSGGGTLTSYVMALDDRVTCAAPACYLTTYRHLIDSIGPQDAEQNIFGQLAFGMDHPDYILMRAPKPTLISSTTNDYFSINGAWENYRQSKRIYNRLGHPERIDLVEGDGGHGVPTNNLNAIMRWMRRWLLDKDDAHETTSFQYHTTEQLQCTPKGQVLLLSGEKSVFDLNAEYDKSLQVERARFLKTNLPEKIRGKIRELAQIQTLEKLPEIQEEQRGTIQRDGYKIEKLLLSASNQIPIPALRFVPKQPDGTTTIFYPEGGKATAAGKESLAAKLAGKGQTVLIVDLPGLGETRGPRSTGDLGDWKNYYMGYLLGKSIVGVRAEAIMQIVRHVRSSSNGKTVNLIAGGETAVPALHAAALSPSHDSVELEGMPASWQPVISARGTTNQLINTVHGAMKFYDLPDLVKLNGKVTITKPKN